MKQESLISKVAKELDQDGVDAYNDFAEALDNGDQEAVSAITDYVKAIKDPRKALLLNTAIREAKRQKDIATLQAEEPSIAKSALATYRGFGSGLGLIPLETGEAYLRSKIQGKPYQESVADIQKEKDIAWEEFPQEYGIGKAAGFVAEMPVGGALFKAAGLTPKVMKEGAKFLPKLPARAGNVAKLGTQSAASALGALPEGEDSIEKRIDAAKSSAMIGGLLIPGIGKGVELAQQGGAALVRGIPTTITKTAQKYGSEVFTKEPVEVAQRSIGKALNKYEQMLKSSGEEIGQVLNAATKSGAKVNMAPVVQTLDDAVIEIQKDVISGGVDTLSANNMIKKILENKKKIVEKIATDGEPISAVTPKAAQWFKNNLDEMFNINWSEAASKSDKALAKRIYGSASGAIKEAVPEVKAPYSSYEALSGVKADKFKALTGISTAKDVASMSTDQIGDVLEKIATNPTKGFKKDLVDIFGKQDAELIVNDAKKAYSALLFNNAIEPGQMKEYFRNRLMFALAGAGVGAAVGGSMGGWQSAAGGALIGLGSMAASPLLIKSYSKGIRQPLLGQGSTAFGKQVIRKNTYPYSALSALLGRSAVESNEEQ
jgi:hypothetical protein